MDKKNHAHALTVSAAAAIIAAGIMLVLGVLGNFGLYAGAVKAMQQWHLFFDLSVGGIIAGMVEAAVITFLIVYAFVLVEQWLASKLRKE